MYDENELNQQEVTENNEVQQPDEAMLATQRANEKQDRNFREMREKLKQMEREKEAALRLVEEERLRKKYNAQSEPAQPSLADDDIPDVRYVKHQLSEVKADIAKERERWEAERAKMEQQAAITRLSAQYPDYADLLSDRNIEVLRTLEPELMASIDSMPDTYSRGVAAIKAAKAFGVVGHDQYKAEKDAIRANATKPKPLNSIAPSQSNSALNQAHNFSATFRTEEDRRSTYEEAVRRSRGG